jgi:DNA-binding NarL/FixJ family response regulator
MNVLIVDDHVLFREGLTSLLNADKYFRVVGQAGSVHEAVALARKLKPDLILMDFSLPDGDGAGFCGTQPSNLGKIAFNHA